MPTSYCTLDELKEWLQIADTRDDLLLQRVIDAVSRWVDGYCGRQFGLTALQARTFQPDDLYLLQVGDVGDDTGVEVATDVDGDGTFETVWSAADFYLLPVDAPFETPDPEPWTELRAIGGHTFPLTYGHARCDRVQVTAAWGWPAIPDTVHQACVMQASRVFKRRDSPQGVLGGGDFGVVRVTSRLDPDVEQMLCEYRAATSIVNLA